MVCVVGSGYCVNPAKFASHDEITEESAGAVAGSDGADVSGFEKLNALVRSPTVDLRHAERFGTSAPKRVSRNRSSDVWSNRSEQMNPPRLKGEITSIGTRNPSPIGPLMFPATEGSGSAGAVMYSPAVPGGAVTGGTWSKKPPF